jgi:hypothetical protein
MSGGEDETSPPKGRPSAAGLAEAAELTGPGQPEQWSQSPSTARQLPSSLELETEAATPVNKDTIPPLVIPGHLWPGRRQNQHRSATRCPPIAEGGEDGAGEQEGAHISTHTVESQAALGLPYTPQTPDRQPPSFAPHRNRSARRPSDARSPLPYTQLGKRSRRPSQEQEPSITFTRPEFEAMLRDLRAGLRADIVEQCHQMQRSTELVEATAG